MRKAALSFHVLCLLLYAALTLLIYPVARAQAKAASKAAPARSRPARSASFQGAYAARVRTIGGELRPLLAEVLTTFDEMEENVSYLSRRTTTRSTSSTAASKAAAAEELKTLKASLLAKIAKARSGATRLRAVSPVPRSLRKADKSLVNASLELEDGLDTLVAWTQNPINELKLRASRQLRKGLNYLDSAMQEIRRQTDPAIQSKTYVDG